MMISIKVTQKEFCENSKGESSNITTNASIEEQLKEFKGKKKRNITNINKVFAAMLVKNMNQ